MFFIQDGGEDLVNTKRQMISQMESDDAGLESDLLEQIKQIFPSDDDLRASLGVNVGQAYMTDGGWVYEGATSTPAAE